MNKNSQTTHSITIRQNIKKLWDELRKNPIKLDVVGSLLKQIELQVASMEQAYAKKVVQTTIQTNNDLPDFWRANFDYGDG